jgi:5'-nucleotidase
MRTRRHFLKQAGIATALLAGGNFPFRSLATAGTAHGLTILYTNDVHSQLQPFPEDAPQYAGLGGAAARAALIAGIRKESEHVLLLDAGDMFQASPLFDLYQGTPEMNIMNSMQYDAVTIGDHDFDGGIEVLARQCAAASFPVLCSNYKTEGTLLHNKLQPYTVLNKGALRVGIFGVGVQLKGLAPDNIASAIGYIDALAVANDMARRLKQKEHCHLVICLSHLGLEYNYNKVSDRTLAAASEHIDVIIGGHSHSFLYTPLRLKNKHGNEILVCQAGWGGAHLGRLDFIFSDQKNILSGNAQTVVPVK